MNLFYKLFTSIIYILIPTKKLKLKFRAWVRRNDYIYRISVCENMLKDISKAISDPNGISRYRLMLHNAHIPLQYRHIFFEMPEDAICIDCGANIGLITDIMLESGGIVHAFDPARETAKLYARKYQGNSRVKFYNIAVSNKESRIKFSTSGSFDTGGSIEAKRSRYNSSYEVEVIRLVDFLKQQKNIYFLKIDVEGAEFDILEDILETGIYRDIKHIAVETHVRFDKEALQPRLAKIEAEIAHKGIENIYLDWA